MSLHFQEVGKHLQLNLLSGNRRKQLRAVCLTLTSDSMESTAVVLPWTRMGQLKYI